MAGTVFWLDSSVDDLKKFCSLERRKRKNQKESEEERECLKRLRERAVGVEGCLCLLKVWLTI